MTASVLPTPRLLASYGHTKAHMPMSPITGTATALPFDPESIPIIKRHTVPFSSIDFIREQHDNHVVIEGQAYNWSHRFVVSIGSILGINHHAMMRLFDISTITPQALFRSIQDRGGASETITITTAEHEDGPVALGAVKPGDPLIDRSSVISALTTKHLKIVRSYYVDGAVRVICRPTIPHMMTIGDHEYERCFMSEIPLDGQGHVVSYCGLIDPIHGIPIIPVRCKWRTECKFAKIGDTTTQLRTFLGTLSNDEGFTAISEHLENASQTPTSLREWDNAVKRLRGHVYTDDKEQGGQKYEVIDFWGPIHQRWGNPYQRYGIANANELNARQMSLLPTAMPMSDMIRHVASLFGRVTDQVVVDRFMGDLFSASFDLENFNAQDPGAAESVIRSCEGNLNRRKQRFLE